MGVALTMWLDYNEHAAAHSQDRLCSIHWRVFFFFVTMAFGGSIGFSRVFLGAHSWNQLLFGWQLAIWLACTLHFCFKRRIEYHLAQLLAGRDTAL